MHKKLNKTILNASDILNQYWGFLRTEIHFFMSNKGGDSYGLTIKSAKYIFTTSFICARGLLFLDRMFKFPNILY